MGAFKRIVAEKKFHVLLLLSLIFMAGDVLATFTYEEEDAPGTFYGTLATYVKKKSIIQLNTNSSTEGVNPLNGGLVLNVSDIGSGGRNLPLALNRIYSSKKVWEYNPDLDQYYLTNQNLLPSGNLGQGWFLHFGKRTLDGTSYRIEFPNGEATSLGYVSGSTYVSGDSRYYLMKGDTLFDKNGNRMIFTDSVVTKTIDKNGNYNNYFYTLRLNIEGNIYVPDSVISSNGKKITLYHGSYEYDSWWLLDSVKTKGFGGQDYRILYHYQSMMIYTPMLDTGYFCDMGYGPFDETMRYVLKSVVYPDGDSVCYDYNNKGELTAVNNPQGGQTYYGYGMYRFSFPEQDVPWIPTDTVYVRSIDTVKVKDSPTGAYKSTLYTRTDDARRSNPENCQITDPYGNDMVYHYNWSGGYDDDTYKYFPGYGTLLKTTTYIGPMSSGVVYDSTVFKYVSDDPYYPLWGSNLRPSTTTVYRGNKTYKTNYGSYDSYGNARVIGNLGDSAVTWDDRYTYREYAHDNSKVIVQVQVSGSTPVLVGSTTTISMPYSSATGVCRTELFRNGYLFNAQDFSPSISGTRTYSWNTTGMSAGDYVFYAKAYDAAGNASATNTITITLYTKTKPNPKLSSINSLSGPEATATVTAASVVVSTDVYPFANSYDETHRHILDRVVRQYDSTATDGKLSEVLYRYDDYGRVDSAGYSSYPPVMWQTPHQMPRGLVTTIKRWQGGTTYDSTRLYYDQCGSLVKTINANGDSAKVSYLAAGDPDKYQYAWPCRSISYVGTDSLQAITEYDSCTGLVTKSIGANADTSRFTYDILGRNLKTYCAAYDSAVSIRHYYNGAYPNSVVDSVLIKRTPLTYLVKKSFINGFGQVIQTQTKDSTGYSIIVNAAYDSLGRVSKTSNPIQTATAFGTYVSTDYWSTQPKIERYYDALSRPLKTFYQDGTRDSASYFNNTVTGYDGLNHTQTAINNSFGAPDTVIDGLNHLTLYNYDRLGRLTSLTDASGKTTYNYYDYLGRLRGSNCPDASSSYTYNGYAVDGLVEYDNLGNITWSKNAKGEINYLYDDLSRVTEVDSANTSYPKVKYFYDTYTNSGYATPPDSLNNAKGRMTRLITVGVDTTWFVYDKLGRTKKKIYAYEGMAGGRDSVIFEYNAAGTCTSMVYPDGNRVNYAYNSTGRLSSVPGFVSGVTYNAAGQPLYTYHAENNMTNMYAYDSRLRPSNISARDGNSVYQLQLQYSYWQDGNIKKIEDYLNSAYTQYYDYTTSDSSYDALGRLKRCAVGSTLLTYNYDNVGNRTQETIGGTTNSLSYTAGTNKIYNATVSGTSYTYAYDNSGNVIRKTWNPDNQNNYYYNYANMLTRAELNGARTITNYYGGGGSLKIKKTDSQTGSRYYAYNGIDPLCEYDSTGTIKKKYVYAFGKCIGMIDSVGRRYLYHHDQVGSVRLVTDTTGAVVNRYYYYPFGDSLSYSGTLANELQFTGKPNVPGMEAYDFSARYYDPAIGRFYSMDPIFNPATSPYAYCHNNPVNMIDPSGMAQRAISKYDNDMTPPFAGYSLGGGTSFASWHGTMRSFMEANPGFRFQVAYDIGYDNKLTQAYRGERLPNSILGGAEQERGLNPGEILALCELGGLAFGIDIITDHRNSELHDFVSKSLNLAGIKGYDVSFSDGDLMSGYYDATTNVVSIAASTFLKTEFLLTVFAHEIGHSLGLGNTEIQAWKKEFACDKFGLSITNTLGYSYDYLTSKNDKDWIGNVARKTPGWHRKF